MRRGRGCLGDARSRFPIGPHATAGSSASSGRTQSRYEDWIPFLVAFGYVVVHHGLAGRLSPESVYNHALAHPWKWVAIHGLFVAAAAAGAVVSWRLNERSRARAADAVAHAVRSQEANEMTSRFLATTSHELRTPLTSISGFVTTLVRCWEEVGEVERGRWSRSSRRSRGGCGT